MGGILREWRMSLSVLAAIMLIGGSYLLARMSVHAPVAEASEESALLKQVATKDTDADGLADWEEQLYGTDPRNPDTRGLGMTDGAAVAGGLIVPKAIAEMPGEGGAGALVNPDLPPAPAEGTLTAAFARTLFTLYLDALKQKGGTLTDADITSITDQAFAGLQNSIALAPDFKRQGDLRVEGAGPEQMKRFAASAEQVLHSYKTGAEKSELLYLKDALENNDAAALERIRSIAKGYRIGAAGIAQLTVPRELAADALLLVNALARMAEVTNDFARVNDDPLATMLALGQYPAAVSMLADALAALPRDYRAAGVAFAPREPGAALVGAMDQIIAGTAAANTTP